MSTSDVSAPAGPAKSGRWRIARRLLLAAAALATLIAVFYTVENWRGKRAWANCRRELEANGEVLDWAAFIPPPVPDAQNIFKAPKMREWFVKESLLDLAASTRPSGTNTPEPFVVAPREGARPVLAEVRVVTPDAPLDSQPADTVLRLNDPGARAQAARLLSEAIGPCAIGARANSVLVARPVEQIKPSHLVLQADTVPTVQELAAFFPANPLTNSGLAWSTATYLSVDPAGSNHFRVSLKEPVYSAADYLALTEPLGPQFDLLRQALERPYARIDGDYERPYLIPIPNFIRMRNVAQTLSQRTQCHLLLGQPEVAWHELALVHDSCRLLLAEPSGKPITLVAAMINTAVAGLYAGIVEDGLRLHAWREPQLLAIERQLQETDLLAPVFEAFREERAATCRTFETSTVPDLVKLLNFGSPGRTASEKISRWLSTLALTCVPRGWYYQNMVVGSALEQQILYSIDPTNQLVRARHVSEVVEGLPAKLGRRSPYSFLATTALPNFAKAIQTVARNQTLVNQAAVACGLERYRLAQGQYPETLDALVPKFIENLPHDLIGGQPLRYRRTEDGGYLLYSVGWDEKDGGGVLGKSREEGDWVWERR